MVENIISQVSTYLEENDTKSQQIAERTLITRWKIESGHIDVYLHFDEEGHMVRVVGTNFLDVEEQYWDCFYELINDLNESNLFVTIVLDKKEQQIRIEYEHLINEETCADICFNLMMQITRVAEKIYPVFMKTIWGGTTFTV